MLQDEDLEVEGWWAQMTMGVASHFKALQEHGDKSWMQFLKVTGSNSEGGKEPENRNQDLLSRDFFKGLILTCLKLTYTWP